MATELYWTIDDERHSREYRVRIHYLVEAYDDGDATTPPHGGEVVLRGIDVAQVRHFDATGNLARVDIGKAAEKFGESAWSVLENDEFLRGRIDEACRQAGYQGLSPRGVLDSSNW